MKTKHSSFVLACSALLSCVGCASLQSVSMTNIPRGAERARAIEASENNVAFLGIHFDNDFADGVPEELRRQCPNGKVTGVYAKYETKWYVLVENRSVTAKAYCVPGETAQTPAAGAGAAPLSPSLSVSRAAALPSSALPSSPAASGQASAAPGASVAGKGRRVGS